MEWLRSIDMDAKTLELLKAGREEQSPFFKLSVPARLEELEKETEEWAAARLAHINEGEEVRKVKQEAIAMFTFTFWPRVRDPQRALTLFKLMYWTFLFDDVLEDSGRDSRQVAHFASKLFHAIFGHPLYHHDQNIFTPKELLLVEIGLEWWGEMQHDSSISAKKLAHFETIFSGYLLSQAPFTHLAEELMDANKPPSVEEFMALRRISVAMYVFFLGTEYALGIDLDNETLNHPLVKQFHEAIANQCCQLNDFFSITKELQNGHFVSIMPLLHIRNNTLAQHAGQPFVPFHVAVSQAWEIIKAREEECSQLASLILQSPISSSNPAIKEYVEDLCGLLPSMRVASSSSTRYKDPRIASCALASFALGHERICLLAIVRNKNPQFSRLKNVQYLKGFLGFRSLDAGHFSHPNKGTSFAVGTKLTFKGFSSIMTTFGTFLL